MSIKSDMWIKEKSQEGMISPFIEESIESSVISYGVSSYGYDARCGNSFYQIPEFSEIKGLPYIIDPKSFIKEYWKEYKANKKGIFILNKRTFVLTYTLESFFIPRDVFCLVTLKSTYARCGLIMSPTTLEPEWNGQITLELFNSTNHDVLLYPNEGIVQIVFMGSDTPCLKSYLDKKGKYQNQSGVTFPKIK